MKAVMRYYSTSNTMAKIKKTDHAKCWQRCGATGTLLQCQQDCKLTLTVVDNCSLRALHLSYCLATPQ